MILDTNKGMRTDWRRTMSDKPDFRLATDGDEPEKVQFTITDNTGRERSFSDVQAIWDMAYGIGEEEGYDLATEEHTNYWDAGYEAAKSDLAQEERELENEYESGKRAGYSAAYMEIKGEERELGVPYGKS